MPGGSIVLKVDISKYKYVDIDADAAIEFLEKIGENIGKITNDIKETIRYIKNFDEFYEYTRRKFKDYIALPHRPDDYIKGTAIIDKVKLYIDNSGAKRVVIVFDRRVNTDTIKRTLEGLGYSVHVEREF